MLTPTAQHQLTTYLEQRGYVSKSIQRALYYAKHYHRWLQAHQLNIAEATYKDLLDYIGHLQGQSSSKHKINEALRNLRLYYTQLELPNIAYGVSIRGEQRQRPPSLSAQELDKLYEHYTPRAQKGYWRHSDKLLLGLIVYQCLDPYDLFRLTLQDLDLEQGTLYIPAGLKRKAARKLQLEAHQIMPLHHYVQHHREASSEKLFSPQGKRLHSLKGQLKALVKQVKAQAEALGIPLVNLTQVRQSRLTLWIKHHGLRQAQYMAGYKYVGNIEAYRQEDTEDLSRYVAQCHPLQ